jgi:hypothetical protein
MAKTEPKTQKTKASVADFIAAIEDEKKRKDAKAVDKLMRAVSGAKPVLWGPSIIGYGEYAYMGASGRSGVWPKIGFSPRKTNLTLYIMPGFDKYDALLKKLGKHKTGKSCLYINKLADVDEAVLRELAERSWKLMTEKHG